MSMSTEETRRDLAFLKRMTLLGLGDPAPAPLLMAVFGLAYGAVALGSYVLMVTGQLSQPSGLATAARLVLWPAAHLAFLLALLWTGWRWVRGGYPVSRAAAAAWGAAFAGFVTLFVAFRIYTRGEPPTDQVYTSYMFWPVVLTLWGCAWWVTGTLAARRTLQLVAAASFLAALAAAAIGNSVHMLLLAGLCLWLLAFAPAVLLMRARR